MHPAWKRLVPGLLLGVFLMPVWSGPLRDAIIDRALAKRMAAEQSGEAGEGSTKPIDLPSGARAERDVSYGSDPKQVMDVYIPTQAGPGRLLPVIFMVHGGAWMIGDKGAANVVANKVMRWLPKGYVVISPNYRMLPHADPLVQAQDVGKALSLAQSRAREWGGDPARFLLMGHSAGAHLVSLISADPSIAIGQGAKPWLGTVSLDSASMDVVRTMEEKHYSFYDKVFGSDRNFWRQTSPFHRLTQAPAPMLLVCSSKRDDACPQARSFVDKVQSLGGRASVLTQDLTHGDVNGKLGLPGAYTDSVEAFLRSVGLP